MGDSVVYYLFIHPSNSGNGSGENDKTDNDKDQASDDKDGQLRTIFNAMMYLETQLGGDSGGGDGDDEGDDDADGCSRGGGRTHTTTEDRDDDADGCSRGGGRTHTTTEDGDDDADGCSRGGGRTHTTTEDHHIGADNNNSTHAGSAEYMQSTHDIHAGSVDSDCRRHCGGNTVESDSAEIEAEIQGEVEVCTSELS